MHNALRFPYLAMDAALGAASMMPLLPFSITYHQRTSSALGLLDTGASVNVLPFHIGVELGATWDPNAEALRLTGNLATYDAQPLVVSAQVGHFDSVRLAFALSQAENIPVILGQVNFFMAFDACFFRTQQAFEIHPK